MAVASTIHSVNQDEEETACHMINQCILYERVLLELLETQQRLNTGPDHQMSRLHTSKHHNRNRDRSSGLSNREYAVDS